MDLSNNPKTKARLIYISGVLIAGCIAVWYLTGCTCHADVYNEYVFQPWQLLRISVLRYVPISIGDIVYLSWVFGLIIFVIKCLYQLFSSHQEGALWNIIVKGIASLASVYIFFMLGWGGNYYKQPLEQYWQLDKQNWNDSSLVAFDKFLVQQMNATVHGYHDHTFKLIRDEAIRNYKNETDCANKGKGLCIKPSLFGNMLQYMGVQGYYNPFTGEGQVNKNELPFMMPYIVSHELAHQSGVGAEDDANMLAYAVAVSSNDSTFRYSAYFSLWLYTHIQVRMRDTTLANEIKKELNSISLRHLDELRKQRKKYRSKFSSYTGDMYDQYLKFNHQKDGIESYDKVTLSAYAWEHKRIHSPESKIYIP